MNRMTGETCTMNPFQFDFFNPDFNKTFDINPSGDFINFDLSTQMNDFFNSAMTPQQQQQQQLPEEDMQCSSGPQGETTMEDLMCDMVLPLHQSPPLPSAVHHTPQSQYDQDMDQVQQLIVREVMGDIRTACQLIDIPTDPYRWNMEQVQKWVGWTKVQYRLPEIDTSFFAFDGMSLCNLTDEQFRQILPKSGDILFAHLDIWKNAARMNMVDGLLSPDIPAPRMPADDRCQYADFTSAGYETSSSMSNSDDEVSLPSPCPSGPNTYMTPNHKGSIHLWQFLKDLLLQPDSYGYCIRWIDRALGIFKIEDSVEVARLWGLRKNRPAMNYDKLSRSIRQYYRKGIMKKTDVAQRLVYQFVNPC